VECGDRFCPVVITVLFLGLSVWGESVMRVKIYLNDVHYLTVDNKDVDGMIQWLRQTGQRNITLREELR